MNKQMTKELCQQWAKNPLKNPKTNRKIKHNGPTYKKLKKQCNLLKLTDIFNKPNPRKPKVVKKYVKPERPNPRKPKVIKKYIKPVITEKMKLPAGYIQRIKKREEKIKKDKNCKAWKLNPVKNPKTNRKIKLNGPTYKKFQKMCKDDMKIQKSLKLIDTSVKRITKVYRAQSPDLIIKKATKRIKTKDVKLVGGTKLTEMIMILYLLKKHKENINLLLRTDFKKLFAKLNTNQITINDIRSLDYLTLVVIDNKTNLPKSVHFPYNDNAMDQYFWASNNPKDKQSKNRFTFLLMSIYSDKPVLDKTGKIIKNAWAHMNFMVYDNLDNTVYRFEPNGGVVDFYDTIVLDGMLRQHFTKWSVKYKTMNDFCPMLPSGKGKMATYGPQALESRKDEQISDPGGFCAYWSIFFIDYIITNHKRPGFSNETIPDHLSNMISDINYKFKSYKNFIRTFSVFINTAARNIGKNRDIDAYIDKMIKEI